MTIKINIYIISGTRPSIVITCIIGSNLTVPESPGQSQIFSNYPASREDSTTIVLLVPEEVLTLASTL